MNKLQLAPNLRDDHLFDLEELLRSRYPNRKEKYYQIILKARGPLIHPTFKVELTADAIIKICRCAKPTWYSYFRSANDFYADMLIVLGSVMQENAFMYLKANATYKEWIPIARSLNMMVFLSNTNTLVSFYPELRNEWGKLYESTITGYADILSPILKLSPNRAILFIKSIANELILRPDQYVDQDLTENFIERQYILFLTEQNS